jgi:hypothetical protein
MSDLTSELRGMVSGWRRPEQWNQISPGGCGLGPDGLVSALPERIFASALKHCGKGVCLAGY